MRWTSPRTTQGLHEAGDLPRFPRIVLILHQAPRLRCLGDRLSRCLGATQASSPCNLVECTQPIASETQRERMRSRRHAGSVAQSALHSTRAVVDALPSGVMSRRPTSTGHAGCRPKRSARKGPSAVVHAFSTATGGGRVKSAAQRLYAGSLLTQEHLPPPRQARRG
jgi:hypothetical protein